MKTVIFIFAASLTEEMEICQKENCFGGISFDVPFSRVPPSRKTAHTAYSSITPTLSHRSLTSLTVILKNSSSLVNTSIKCVSLNFQFPFEFVFKKFKVMSTNLIQK